MVVNALDKVIINFVIGCTLCIATPVLAETNDYNDDLEENTAVKNITDQQDIGVFVLSRIVAADTGKPVENAEISSATNKTFTAANGEFLLKVNPKGSILIRKANYKDITILVSALRGKIKLELIPRYLPIFPNLSGSFNYRNLGFSEKFNDITASGRFNDSFSIEASGKLLNSILIGLEYENINGILNRSKISEKAKLSNQLISLKGAYVFNILKDTLDIATGVKGYWNNIDISNQVFNEEADRDLDYFDFGSTRIGVGLNIDIGGRPIRYTPLVFNVFGTYYPLINVTQPTGGLLPANPNELDFGVSARFDFAGAFVQAKYLNKNIFQGSYTSNLSGFSVGVGYGF